VSMPDLCQNLVDWYKFMSEAMAEYCKVASAKCKFAQDEMINFASIIPVPEEDPLSGIVDPHAPWVKRDITYIVKSGWSCCTTKKLVERTILFDEMLRRKKARTKSGRSGVKRAITNTIRKLKAEEESSKEVIANKGKLRKAFDAADTDKSGTIEFEELVHLFNEKLKMEKDEVEIEEMFHAADKDDSGTIDFDEFTRCQEDVAKEKRAQWKAYFEKGSDLNRLRRKGYLVKDRTPLYNMTFVDEKGKERKGKSFEPKMFKEMMKEQRGLDAVVKDWSKILDKGIEKMNMIFLRMRSDFIKYAKVKITVATVLERIKVMLAEVAAETVEQAKKSVKGPAVDVKKPSLKIEKNFKLLFAGKNPITKLTMDMGGPTFTQASFQSPTKSKNEALQFIYDSFFNPKSPKNVMNMFSMFAAQALKAIKNSVKLGLRIANFARKCLPPFPIIAEVQTQVMKLCQKSAMSLGFKIRNIPSNILKHVRKFATFPLVAMSFAKACKGIMTMFGSKLCADNPSKALTLKEDEEEKISEKVDMEELGGDFAKGQKRANSAKDQASSAEKEQAKMELSAEDRAEEQFVNEKDDEEPDEDDPDHPEYDLSDAVLETKFAEIDVDGDGEVTRTELEQAYKDSHHDVADDALTKIVNEADANGDGGIDIFEFKQAMRQGQLQA